MGSRQKVCLALVAFLLVLSGFFHPAPAHAGNGNIPIFSINASQTSITGHIEVSCPGNTGFDWRVGIESGWFDEETVQSKDFYFPTNKVSIGHHNAIAQLHCAGEDWNNATQSNVGFDWYGGPTPIPPPPGQASISISPGQVTVLPNTAVQFTVAGACSGQPLRAIHISVDGGNINEQSFSPVPYTWPGAASGTHTLLAQVACSDDLQWQHGASGTASIVVVQPTPVPPPAQPTPIPPPPAQPTPVPPGQPTPVPPVQSNPTNVPVQVQPTAVPPSQNGGGQINGDGVCSPQRELVNARMIVIVNNKTPSDVLVHNNPVKGSPIKFTVPVQHLMSIISGPKCDNGWTFWEVGYNGNSGWAVESTASGYNYVPNGTSLPYYGSEGQPSGSNGNQPPPAAPPPSGNGSCGRAPATRMDVGGRGDVTHTDGTPDRIHQSPSVHSSPAGEPLAEGTQFTVLQGPTCGDGYQFWRVRADDGREGWVAEGDSSNYFIEPIGNLSSNPDHTINKTITIDNEDFVLTMDTTTYLILNGSDFTIHEIERIQRKVDIAASYNDKLKTVISYAFPSIPLFSSGGSEKIRNQVELQFCGEDTSCKAKLHYKVHDRSMDTSGIGNLVFGYFSAEFGLASTYENWISNIDQGFNPKSLGQFIDNPDDITQRTVGRKMYEKVSNGSRLSTSLLNEIAISVGLF